MRWSTISHDAIYSQITHVVASPLLDTPDEIWMIIFADFDSSTLATLCLVAKRFRAIATPFLYHDPFGLLGPPLHATHMQIKNLVETLADDPSLTALIRVYRDVYIRDPDSDADISLFDEEDEYDGLYPAFVPKSVFEAMGGLIRADITHQVTRFIRFCPSRNNLLELEIRIEDEWSWEECAMVSLWLGEQQRIRRLVWTSRTPCLLPIPGGVFPDLRNLTCDSSMAANLLQSRPIHTFRCRDEDLTVNTRDELAPLTQHFSQHLHKVQFLVEVEGLNDIIKLLVVNAPHLVVLKFAISGPVRPVGLELRSRFREGVPSNSTLIHPSVQHPGNSWHTVLSVS
ncbi:hypothetical protein FRB93_002794 [Tulasnella sp. JGI-2019a]|nr:hypothetical protein FRB93_002794 [Tulasnella sp. JGI-2019a]